MISGQSALRWPFRCFSLGKALLANKAERYPWRRAPLGRIPAQRFATALRRTSRFYCGSCVGCFTFLFYCDQNM